FCRRISSMVLLLYPLAAAWGAATRAVRIGRYGVQPGSWRGRAGSRTRVRLRRGHASDVVVVGVRDQGQETGALDRGGQLALVARLGAGHAARDDLAVLGQVLAQGVEILVIDLLDALGGELAELAAAEELGH